MRERVTRKSVKIAASVFAGVLATSTLSACGGSDSGTPTINVYGSTSDAGFDKILADCNKDAAGKYTIVPNLIPSDADSQREQFVRRLAAHDDGMDVLGMDVTWTAEFAEAGWIRELTGDKKAQATAGVLQPPIDTATWKDKLYAIPRSTNVQLLWRR
jgi:multiple sugar transport system substrate-binding protein